MSIIRADSIKNRAGNGAPDFPNGITVTGVVTSTTLNASITGNLSVTGNLGIGGTITYEDVTNVDSVGVITARAGINLVGNDLNVGSNIKIGNASGIVTATSFSGNGANLTGISVGIATEASVATNGTTVVLDLSKDDHKVLAAGVVTIDVTGGTEGDSHTVRIQNTGIATVGFATHFLFPSGAAPGLPVTSGSKSMITFTVHKVGAAGTELFTGASVSFS